MKKTSGTATKKWAAGGKIKTKSKRISVEAMAIVHKGIAMMFAAKPTTEKR